VSEERPTDYYEVLQISANAEPDTVHRVYRLLAQRFHPDNQETGDVRRFCLVREAYTVLSDPESRAQYDIGYEGLRRERWRLVSSGERSENDFEFEEVVRLTVLEALYTRRRIEPRDPGIFNLDLEGMIGRSRDQLEFTIWYLIQRGFVSRTDNSRLTITVEGVDYLERHYQDSRRLRRLNASAEAL
jgi:curved DNA-binding protein CbpA